MRCALTLLLLLTTTTTSVGIDEFEQPPINYSSTQPSNRISQLQSLLDEGKQQLTFHDELGYLPSLLAALDIPAESQTLVYSKTSLQTRYITPKTPRALYFSDEIYVGYVQSGAALEISVADPRLGTVFYTLDQAQVAAPKLERQTDRCLLCHSSSRTEGVPGHVVRSLFVDLSGQPIYSAGSRMVDHTTPIENRWGGWYVTGKHGEQKHLGNFISRSKEVPREVDNSAGQNVLDLSDRFDVSRYLTPHSDIVSLMVLEHQVLVHNRLTRANFSTQQALAYDASMKRSLGESEAEFFDSTKRRIQSAAEALVEALLLVDEAKLTAPMSGTAAFAQKFQELGPRDKAGRSLRDLDLQTRLFKYPCSYLIYSPSFAALPKEVREQVWKQLRGILSGADQSEKFAHLTAADREAIYRILRETHPQLPEDWKLERP